MPILLILVILPAVQAGRAEIFSSTAHMTRVLHVVAEIVQILRGLLNNTEAESTTVQRYIDDFERMQRDLVPRSDDEILLSHPIRAFQFLTRLASGQKAIQEFLKTTSWAVPADYLKAMQLSRLRLLLPTEEDIRGAASALVNLQDIYDLHVSDLVRGEIFGHHSAIGLSASDCLLLGKSSVGFPSLAVQWYNQALLMSSLEDNSKALEEEIIFFLERDLRAHKQANVMSTHTAQKNSHNKSEFPGFSPFHLGKDILFEDEKRNYKALCQGQKIRGPEVESFLYCYFSDQRNPYFRLHPVKIEENNLDPAIYTFHDILSESEIEFIKQFVRPKLKRSTIAGEISVVRTSQHAWIFDNHRNESVKVLLFRIMRRISFITGLKILGTENAEALQVANYGIAGHYVPHCDFFFDVKTSKKTHPDPAFGNRIATFMFYLSDVMHGGATVFPRVGAAVWPQKGSAAFWYNLRSNGDVDPETLHGACPVVYGSKWVATKWIRERNQLFTRPCGLSPAE